MIGNDRKMTAIEYSPMVLARGTLNRFPHVGQSVCLPACFLSNLDTAWQYGQVAFMAKL